MALRCAHLLDLGRGRHGKRTVQPRPEPPWLQLQLSRSTQRGQPPGLKPLCGSHASALDAAATPTRTRSRQLSTRLRIRTPVGSSTCQQRHSQGPRGFFVRPTQQLSCAQPPQQPPPPLPQQPRSATGIPLPPPPPSSSPWQCTPCSFTSSASRQQASRSSTGR